MTNLRFYNYGDWVGVDQAEPNNGQDDRDQPGKQKSEPADEKQPEHEQESLMDMEPPTYDEKRDEAAPPPPEGDRPGPSSPPPGAFPEEPPHHHGHHGPPGCGARGRGARFHRGGPFGPHGGHGWGAHPFAAGPGRCGPGGSPGMFPGAPRGGLRGWGGFGGPGGRWRAKQQFWQQFRDRQSEGSFNMEAIANFLRETFGIDINGGRGRGSGDAEGDYSPPVDVFETTTDFVIHVSLAGAKKEDLGVTWNPEDSTVQIAGVIHRPGDEDFLKTIAMDERNIGPFARQVRLGDRAHPASVDADAITARMEDGVLMVNVPKVEKEPVEAKKVNVQ